MGSGHQCSGVRAYFVSAAVPAGVTECSGEVPTGTDGSGLASCRQGVDDAADNLPT